MGFHLRGVKLGDVLGLEPFIGAGHEIDVAVAFVGLYLPNIQAPCGSAEKQPKASLSVFIHQLQLAKSGAENLNARCFPCLFSRTEEVK